MAIATKNPADKSTAIGCLSIIVLALILYFACGGNSSTAPVTRQQRIEKLFSAWNGEHEGLATAVKEQLNDPKSFEHIKTTYTDNGDRLMIYMQYTAKNGFGGTVRGTAKAAIDSTGNIIQVYSYE